MNNTKRSQKLALEVKALRIVEKILLENPNIREIFESSETLMEVRMKLRDWVMTYLEKNPYTKNYYLKKSKGFAGLKRIAFRDYAAIRLLDYLDNEGRNYFDPNNKNKIVNSSPVKNLWWAIKQGKGTANEDFFTDVLLLFRQLNGSLARRIPNAKQIDDWMSRNDSGLDEDIQSLRLKNRERILKIIIKKIEKGKLKSQRFVFDEGMNSDEKFEKANEWWKDYRFHLSFAIRTPELLNEMLDYSLRPKMLKTLKKARNKGIPIFVNPYYLSLLSVEITPGKTGADQALRDYIFPNKELIAEFGQINAWEKEDIVQPGEPNAAGWILPPYYNVHRRYPEVAIFIPDTAGRACGGLCVSCQRMYDFQSGRLNFNLKKLEPKISWPEKLKLLLKYWEKDTQLRDILITGGDSFMNTDDSLKHILDEVYNMAKRKVRANQFRPDGKKYAELLRIRLGTRLPVYLPQRITTELIDILTQFKAKALKIGIRQFVIQTHIQSSMEITPLVQRGIEKLLKAGWTVTNQMVFTAASSKRGHTAKLRKVLNEIGVLPYYTFSVKGFNENYHNFATNERAAQERVEEKYLGIMSKADVSELDYLISEPDKTIERLSEYSNKKGLPFISTDRTVLNLPGVGKSLTYRTIGITDDGRRILEFEHDQTRAHSPIVHSMGNILIIESKSIANYLRQMDKIGENVDEYKTIWGYSASETEPRMPIYQYPEYAFQTTENLTNFHLESADPTTEGLVDSL